MTGTGILQHAPALFPEGFFALPLVFFLRNKYDKIRE
jgi:hypothetical protein